MSSLAAARADNFYFPPEWRPEMGGISKFQGSKGANQYQQYGIIRFELPFDAWCLGCNRHMCKGLRFNAKKDRDGKYFTTTVWAFKTKCPSCEQQFTIKTDPKNSTYEFAEGIRKMEQDFVPDNDDSIIIPNSDETSQSLRNDPIFRLQHEKQDRTVAADRNILLSTLLDHKDSISKNDYDQNQALRKTHRLKKKRSNELLQEANLLGLSIPLVEPDVSDTLIAKTMKFHCNDVDIRKLKESKKFSQVLSHSIFSSAVDNVTTNKEKPTLLGDTFSERNDIGRTKIDKNRTSDMLKLSDTSSSRKRDIVSRAIGKLSDSSFDQTSVSSISAKSLLTAVPKKHEPCHRKVQCNPKSTINVAGSGLCLLANAYDSDDGN